MVNKTGTPVQVNPAEVIEGVTVIVAVIGNPVVLVVVNVGIVL